MANLKEIEQYLNDLDNLKETGHFKKDSVRDYTFYHKEFTLYDFIAKGREYIRQLLMIHKGVAEERPNEVTEALPLHVVMASSSDNKKEWISSKVKCDLCSYEWIAVYHQDSERLECNKCGNMVHFENLP